MLWVILAIAGAAVAATWVYVARERLGLRGAALAALRTAALAAILVLLVNASRERTARASPPTVLLDASLSLDAAGGRWQAALDTARALAGETGRLWRFGDEFGAPTDSGPSAGRSLLLPALRAAASRPGPIYVVTDGELSDVAVVPEALLAGIVMIVLPRDTLPDAALRGVSLPQVVAEGDSLELQLDLTLHGALTESTASLEVSSGGRVLARREVGLPPAPATVRRRVVLPPGALRPGTHVLDVRIAVAGDRESRTDLRRRLVTVGGMPEIVLLARPPDWESRFLARELDHVTRSAVLSFAEVAPGRWVDMRTSRPVAEARVREAARSAALLVLRGDVPFVPSGGTVWRWPIAGERTIAGDWYAMGQVTPSPLAARLGLVEWDSVPPATGVTPVPPAADTWVALSARLARRGAERPLLTGSDAGARRSLTTTGDGLWRWALRGGASREAYRALLAAGVDWLLRPRPGRGGALLTASDVVPRGIAATFRWSGDSVPPTGLAAEFTSRDTTVQVELSFDASGVARQHLHPGIYRWRVPSLGSSGTLVVEEYSDEFAPQPVVTGPGGPAAEGRGRVRAREAWWIFALAIGLLLVEWAWRIRRGLP